MKELARLLPSMIVIFKDEGLKYVRVDNSALNYCAVIKQLKIKTRNEYYSWINKSSSKFLKVAHLKRNLTEERTSTLHTIWPVFMKLWHPIFSVLQYSIVRLEVCKLVHSYSARLVSWNQQYWFRILVVNRCIFIHREALLWNKAT